MTYSHINLPFLIVGEEVKAGGWMLEKKYIKK